MEKAKIDEILMPGDDPDFEKKQKSVKQGSGKRSGPLQRAFLSWKMW